MQMRHPLGITALLLILGFRPGWAGPPVPPDPTIACIDLKGSESKTFPEVPSFEGKEAFHGETHRFGLEEHLTLIFDETGADITLSWSEPRPDGTRLIRMFHLRGEGSAVEEFRSVVTSKANYEIPSNTALDGAVSDLERGVFRFSRKVDVHDFEVLGPQLLADPDSVAGPGLGNYVRTLIEKTDERYFNLTKMMDSLSEKIRHQGSVH